MSALLSLQNASVWLGATSALAAATLQVAAGEVVALAGPNGAGKTTLIRAALGIVALHAGRASLSGDDPRRLSARQRALRAAYLPQKPFSVWPVTVECLVALGRFAHGAAPDRLGARDQATVDLALEACLLTPLRKRRMDAISGGERVRAHLARTLAQGAPLLMLDEPTAGLDPAQSLAVGDILHRHAAAGGAVVFSTHDIALAARCSNRTVLLKQGRIISQGAPESALTPDSIEAAFGRKGALHRVGGAIAAVFV